MTRLALGLVALLATAALGAVIDAKLTPVGTLTPSAQTATGPSANSLKFGSTSRFRAVVFTLRNTAGTATADLRINCTGNAADWGVVDGSSRALAVEAVPMDVVYPGCEYRVQVTACSGCSLVVNYTVLPELQ